MNVSIFSVDRKSARSRELGTKGREELDFLAITELFLAGCIPIRAKIPGDGKNIVGELHQVLQRNSCVNATVENTSC